MTSPGSSDETKPVFKLDEAFQHLQDRLLLTHAGIRTVTGHPGTLGDQSEADWVMMLSDFLPARYSVGPIFAVDSRGDSSQQIDVAIYDKQYSPMWFGGSGGTKFVPVESVYAVFEAKPTMNSTYLTYAREKVASVRRLHRSSAAIKHAGGTYRATDPSEKHVIGGILTAHSSWTSREGAMAKLGEHLPAPGGEDSLDIGVALDQIAFDYTPAPVDGQTDEPETRLTFSDHERQLIHFAIRLFDQLQRLGTVLALDMREYESALGRRQ
ncbi:hypothetical protein GCM10023339_27900 [Alloalcanivorax gelatiniphagus]